MAMWIQHRDCYGGVVGYAKTLRRSKYTIRLSSVGCNGAIKAFIPSVAGIVPIIPGQLVYLTPGGTITAAPPTPGAVPLGASMGGGNVLLNPATTPSAPRVVSIPFGTSISMGSSSSNIGTQLHMFGIPIERKPYRGSIIGNVKIRYRSSNLASVYIRDPVRIREFTLRDMGDYVTHGVEIAQNQRDTPRNQP